jgi:hypothetical protein
MRIAIYHDYLPRGDQDVELVDLLPVAVALHGLPRLNVCEVELVSVLIGNTLATH